MARSSNTEAKPLEVVDSPLKRPATKPPLEKSSPSKEDSKVEDLFANLTLLNAVAFDSDDEVNDLKPLPGPKSSRKPRAAQQDSVMPKARPQRRKAARKKYYSDDDDEEESDRKARSKATATPRRAVATTATSTRSSRMSSADQPYPATPSRSTRAGRSNTPMSEGSEVGSLVGSKTPGIMKGGRRIPSLFDDEEVEMTPRRRVASKPIKPRLYEEDENDGQLDFLQGFQGLKGGAQATNLKKSLAALKRDLDVEEHYNDRELVSKTARSLKATARTDDGFKDIDFKKPQFTTPRSKVPVHPPKSVNKTPVPPALKDASDPDLSDEEGSIIVLKPPVAPDEGSNDERIQVAEDNSIINANNDSPAFDSEDDEDDEPVRRPTRQRRVVPDEEEEEEEEEEESEMSDSDADPVAAQLRADAAAAARRGEITGRRVGDSEDDDDSFRTLSPEPANSRRSLSVEVQISPLKSKETTRLSSTAHLISETDSSKIEELRRSVGDQNGIVDDEVFGSNSEGYISKKLLELSVKDTKKTAKEHDIIILSDDDNNEDDAFVLYEGPSLSPTKPQKPRQTTEIAERSDNPSPYTGLVSEPKMRTKKSTVEASKRSPVELRKFKKTREELANQILLDLEAKLFVGEYVGKAPKLDIEWSEALRKTAGTAKSSRSGRSKITLSTKVVDDETRLWNTLAHEYCHVLNWVFDHHNGHGKSFYKWANTVMKHFPRVNITTCHSYEIQFKYIWQCTLESCQQHYKRHSASIDPARQRCGKCQSKIVQILPVPKATKTLSEYQIFMKEEMARMKKETGKADMGEVAKRWRVESARRKAVTAAAVSGMHKADDDVIAVKDNREIVSIDDDPVESIRTGFTSKISIFED